MSLTALNFTQTANAGAVLHLLHPVDRVPLFSDHGGEKTASTITLTGRDGDDFIKAEREARTRKMENLNQGKPFSAAEQDHQNAVLLARCTKSWTGIPMGWIDGTDNEEPATCSYENALKLYLNQGVSWVREQVDTFVGTRANFLGGSRTN